MGITSWQVGIAANAVIALAYYGISATILIGLWRAGQLRSNALATLTGLIFFSCAAGHATHLEHMLFGAEVEAARTAFDAHMAWVDTVTAAIGIAYWRGRTRFGALLKPVMFADRAARDQQATQLQAAVLQELATADLALDSGDAVAARAAVERAAAATRHVLDGLHADVVRAA